MAVPNNPIDVSKVALPKWQVEGWTQSVLNLWLKKYFSGADFTTVELVEGVSTPVERSFECSDILFNTVVLPQPLVKPVVHWQVSDHREVNCKVGSKTMVQHELTWNVLIRSSAEGDNPDHINQRVASQLASLLEGSERQALSMVGVNRVRKQRGPIVVASREQHIRQLIVTMVVTTENSLNVI